jgi:hypothetical protein
MTGQGASYGRSSHEIDIHNDEAEAPPFAQWDQPRHRVCRVYLGPAVGWSNGMMAVDKLFEALDGERKLR